MKNKPDWALKAIWGAKTAALMPFQAISFLMLAAGTLMMIVGGTMMQITDTWGVKPWRNDYTVPKPD